MKVSYVQELTYATEHAAIVLSLFESYFPSEFPPDNPATKVELFNFQILIQLSFSGRRTERVTCQNKGENTVWD